jgi:hypothetical protein
VYEDEKALVAEHGGTVAMVLAESMVRRNFLTLADTCLAQASECARPDKRPGLFERLLQPGTGPGAGPNYYVFRQEHIMQLQDESREVFQDIGALEGFVEEARSGLVALRSRPKPSSEDLDAFFKAMAEEVDAEREVRDMERALENARRIFAAKENEFMSFTYGGRPVETAPFAVSSLGVNIPLHVSGKGSWLVSLLPGELDGRGHALAIYTSSTRDDYMLYDPDWALLIFPAPTELGAYLQEYLALRGGGGIAQCVVAQVT